MSARGFFAGAAPAALGSLVALAAQALMALFLLHLFEPTAVGVFSLVAQTAFGWATLALAQSPLSLLANQHLGAVPATRQAWRASLRRWLSTPSIKRFTPQPCLMTGQKSLPFQDCC